MALETESTPSVADEAARTTPSTQVNLRPVQLDAPPAYTPFSSTNSLFQSETPAFVTRFSSVEKKALRILAMAGIILGAVSTFVSFLTVVFGTLMYCTGTGFWGGITTLLNGIFCLSRMCRRNKRCHILTLLIFSIVTVMACATSVVLSVVGTSTEVDMCCTKQISDRATGNRICNYSASQLANTVSTCLAFVQTIVGVMTATFYAKHSSVCCLDDEDVHDFTSQNGFRRNLNQNNYFGFS